MNHQNAQYIDSDDESPDNGTTALNINIESNTVYNFDRYKALIKIITKIKYIATPNDFQPNSNII